jgi:hypothetical protein
MGLVQSEPHNEYVYLIRGLPDIFCREAVFFSKKRLEIVQSFLEFCCRREQIGSGS